MALYESILSSPHRTLNGEEADYFFVSVLDSCIITRADDAPHMSMQVDFYTGLDINTATNKCGFTSGFMTSLLF